MVSLVVISVIVSTKNDEDFSCSEFKYGASYDVLAPGHEIERTGACITVCAAANTSSSFA